MTYQILQGDNRQLLKTLPDDSIDAIVTDPPYGISFLGKDWDSDTGSLETYRECFRVLKPGGHILAFSAARTYHHLAITIERAGFEIRDQIMWIYSSGFPKSQDVGRSIQRSLGVKETTPHEYNVPRIGGAQEVPKVNERIVVTDPEAQQWEGWGTALKPAHEPICLARKPTRLSTAKNVQAWGVGALNIDATRIPLEPGAINEKTRVEYSEYSFDNAGEGSKQNNLTCKINPDERGRFPSNVLGEISDYQKYFYCPKVSSSERHMGYDDLPEWCKANNLNPNVGNNHPTVKPVALMEYLIRLITPPGGTVLDPFNGSGSTGMAAVGLGYNYIGMELDPNYVEISRRRIDAWLDRDPIRASGLFDTDPD